jgi:hypothetical protein
MKSEVDTEYLEGVTVSRKFHMHTNVMPAGVIKGRVTIFDDMGNKEL